MEKMLVLIALLLSVGCGNVTTSRSFNPDQRLKNTEGELSRLGVSFNGSNVVVNCESIYKTTCLARMHALQEYLTNVYDLFGSEESMSEAYRQRTKSASNCVENLDKMLKDPAVSTCKR